MIKNDTCVIFRTVVTITPPLNTPISNQITFPTNGFYSCHVGQETGVFSQGNPNATIITKLVMFIDITTNLQNGDIVQINNGTKYIVENVYKPLNKIIKCNLTIKDEV